MSEIEPFQSSMYVLVTSNFDDDSIKQKETSLSNYDSIGYFSVTQGLLTPLLKGSIWPKFVLVYDFLHYVIVS